MDDISDNWLMEDLGLFFILMIVWDIIRSFFIAWLVPRFQPVDKVGLTSRLKRGIKKSYVQQKPTPRRS